MQTASLAKCPGIQAALQAVDTPTVLSAACMRSAPASVAADKVTVSQIAVADKTAVLLVWFADIPAVPLAAAADIPAALLTAVADVQSVLLTAAADIQAVLPAVVAGAMTDASASQSV